LLITYAYFISEELGIVEQSYKPILAEIEFKSEEESIAFKPPAWFSEEITTDERYKNKNLALYGIPKNIK